MTSKLKYFLANCVILFLTLSAIEIFSRIVAIKIYNRDFDSSLIVDNKYLASPGLAENSTGIVWGKEFNTDENGCRRNAKSNRGKKKWLFIGDSVTEGVGVEDTSTFSSLCSEEFAEFNVLNYSLIGYSSADYYNLLQSLLPNDTSVELVTLFFCLNDVYGSAKSKDLPLMAKQNLLGTINSFLQQNSATYKLIKLFFYRKSDRYFRYDLRFYSESNQYFSESMNYLKMCDSICKTQNVFFQVVLFPYKSQLTELKPIKTPQQLVGDFCNRGSINFSDPMDFLRKNSDCSSLYLFADEIHFSDKGHRAIAEFLSE